MTNFSAKSKRILTLLTILSLAAFYFVETNKIDVQRKWYDEKLEASLLAKKAIDFLKEYRLEKGVFIDALNDPNGTALIGQDITIITTDRGYLEAKLTAANPNFAAVIVEMFKEADLKESDAVAVSFTGSLPGLNIAVLSAIQTLKLQPVIISSVGASNWGANDPYFTWLDMENILYDKGIFKHKSAAASIGGGLDKGRGLAPEGRQLIEEAILRNDAEFINEQHLETSISRRMDIYKKISGNRIKCFINVGGGIAALGSIENSEFIPTGLTKVLPMKNYPAKGVLIRMAEKHIPVIHLLNVTQLAQNYGLPVSPEPLPQPGEGDIFVKKQYSMSLTIIVTFLLSAVILFIFIKEKNRHKLGTEQVKVKKQNQIELNEELSV
jgi:poly-gamma-glutamate system protein